MISMTSLYSALLAFTLLLAGTSGQQSYCDVQTGNDLTCFSEPAGCMDPTDCELTMTSEVLTASNTTRFTLTGKSDGWVAIGFSEDQRMGNDDVIMCARNGTSHAQVLDRYNQGRSNIAKTNPANRMGLVQTAGSNVDGVLSCEFNRENSIADMQHFSLDGSTYLLFGRGPITNAGVPTMHAQIPWVSDSMVDLGSGARIARVGETSQMTQSTTTAGSMTIAGSMTTAGSMATHTPTSIALHLLLALVMLVLATDH